MATFLSNISIRDLRRAINLREQIEKLERILSSLLGGTGSSGSGGGYATRRISAAGRARIAAAQRARWAKAKGRKGGGRRAMSAAARAKIAAAARKRWARAKASGKRTLAG